MAYKYSYSKGLAKELGGVNIPLNIGGLTPGIEWENALQLDEIKLEHQKSFVS